MNTATHAAQGTAVRMNVLNGLDFDKTTQHLVKIRDSFENTYIFSLPKMTIGTYANAMSKGKLVAYRLNDAKEFRKPHSQELLSENDFRFLKALPVGDSVKTFLKRIAKVMEPETTEILRGKMRGVEKLAGLKVAKEAAATGAIKKEKKAKKVPMSAGAFGVVESAPVEQKQEAAPAEAPKTDQILYRGKPLEKIGDSYFLLGSENCIHCNGEIKTKAQVSVVNGVAKTQATKKALHKDAGRVEGSRSEWEHYACRDQKKGVEAGAVEPAVEEHHLTEEAAPPAQEPTEAQIIITDVLSALNRTDVSSDWKVGYLTGKYENAPK